MVWMRHLEWLLIMADGSKDHAELEPTWYAQRYLVMLHFKGEKSGKHSILLTEGRIGQENFRRLRVRLRLEAAKGNS